MRRANAPSDWAFGTWRARRARAVLLALVSVLALVVVASSCGVPNDAAPRVITGADGPRPLEPTTAPPTTTQPNRDSTSVYLAASAKSDGSTRLTALERDVPTAAPADRIKALLAVELTTAERDEGLRSEIPVGTELLNFELDPNGILLLDLSEEISSITGPPLTVAFAQLVYTATTTPDVQGVRFKVDGELVDVTDQEGVAKPNALTRADFSSFAPLSPARTSSATTTIDGEPFSS